MRRRSSRRRRATFKRAQHSVARAARCTRSFPGASFRARIEENGVDRFAVFLRRRLLDRGIELGAGWNRISQKTGEEYISVSLSAPEFGTIYGNVAPAPGDDATKKVIIWNPVS